MNNFAISTSDLYLEHDTGRHHPESKERLIAICEYLQSKDYFSKILKVDPEKAKIQDIARVHDSSYIRQVESLNSRSGYLDGDTPFSALSSEAAFYAAGSGITLANLIHSKKLSSGISLVRPPGHHAERENAMGFCIFNNVAITASYLESLGYERIFILDWDVHHGNGTEHAFYSNGNVFFASLHQFPFYPGTGREEDIGKGLGLGKNLNIPLPRGSGDKEYLNAFDSKIVPAIDDFNPDFILISAGFDSHKNDPLGGMEVNTKAFESFTRIILEKAREHCEGRILSFLEGGYDLRGLAESVEAHIAVLQG
jgi:acetoin utilization deacetylase AcuC-like enzyme